MRPRYSIFLPLLLLFLSYSPTASACGYNWVGECSTAVRLRINGSLDSFSIAPCPNGHKLDGLQLGNLKSLSLAGAQAITWESCQNNVTGVSLRYRVYKTGTVPGAFLSFDLEEHHSTVEGPYTTRYHSREADADLSSGLDVGSTYILEVYFSAAVDTLGDDFVPETFLVQDNNGQYYRLTFTYGGPDAPVFAAAITEAVQPKCAGDQNGSIAVGVWGDLTGIHYDWSNVALNFPQQVGLGAGSYAVTVSNGNYSLALTTVLTPAHDPASHLQGLPDEILVTCAAPSLQLCAPAVAGVSYQWRKDGLPGPTTPCLLATAGGVYTLTATESGCTATKAILSEEHKVSPLASATGTASYVTTCYVVDSTIVKYHVGTNAVNPTYEWYLQGQLFSTESMPTLRFPGLMAANPSVKVTDQYGCSVEVPSFVILYPPPSPPFLYLFFKPDLCHPDKTSVEFYVSGVGGGPYNVTWNGELVSQSPYLASPGEYQVVATDVNGCSVAQMVTVHPIISISVQHSQFPNFLNGAISINSVGGLSFQWANGSSSPYLSGLGAGTYCVTISQWGSLCTLDTCITVLGASSAGAEPAAATLRIWPNPARAGDISTVALPIGLPTDKATYTLYDSKGQAKWRLEAPLANDQAIKLQWPPHLEAELYWLEILTAGSRYVGKIVLTE